MTPMRYMLGTIAIWGLKGLMLTMFLVIIGFALFAMALIIYEALY